MKKFMDVQTNVELDTAVQNYVNVCNRMILDTINSVNKLIKGGKGITENTKETRERIFNQAVKTREKLKGFLIGYWYGTGVKYELVEDELLMELRMFDTDKCDVFSPERICTYKIKMIENKVDKSA